MSADVDSALAEVVEDFLREEYPNGTDHPADHAAARLARALAASRGSSPAKWSCTKDHVTEPCGECDGCRNALAASPSVPQQDELRAKPECTCDRSAAFNCARAQDAEIALAVVLAQQDELREAFRPGNFACYACHGDGQVNGRNHDDPRWVSCLTCKGTGLRPNALAALASSQVDDQIPTKK